MDKIVQQTTVTREIDSLRQDGAREDKRRNLDILTTDNSRIVKTPEHQHSQTQLQEAVTTHDQRNLPPQEIDNNSQCNKTDLTTMKLKLELAKIEREQHREAFEQQREAAAIRKEEKEREIALKEREAAIRKEEQKREIALKERELEGLEERTRT
ncbi:DDRGK domain-containing protein 1-like [Procambarus clarkii]|uniref:DDRGK domain-containing protein 1-like n=1 Tax=Procambarus clarkii TaxID=6728 RepID=UPI0037441AC7